MDRVFEDLVLRLKTVCSAYEAYRPEAEKFNERAFRAMSVPEQIDFLTKVRDKFFGREGLDRAMVASGALNVDDGHLFLIAFHEYRDRLGL